MENGKQTQTHHSLPLVSRLEHLEFMMKYLEGKQNTPRLGSSNNNATPGVERQNVPLNLAVREAYFKGSLLDRVASLEHRLFQLCLELESSSTSCTNSTGEATASASASSSQESKRELSYSLPTFNYQCQQQQPAANNYKQEESQSLSQPLIDRSEIDQGKCDKVQERNKHASAAKKKHGKSKPNRDEKTCKNTGKKRVPPSWPHLKLLGC